MWHWVFQHWLRRSSTASSQTTKKWRSKRTIKEEENKETQWEVCKAVQEDRDFGYKFRPHPGEVSQPQTKTTKRKYRLRSNIPDSFVSGGRSDVQQQAVSSWTFVERMQLWQLHQHRWNIRTGWLTKWFLGNRDTLLAFLNVFYKQVPAGFAQVHA